MSSNTSLFQPGKILQDVPGMEDAHLAIYDLISGRDSASSAARQFEDQAKSLDTDGSKDAASQYLDKIQATVVNLAVETPATQSILVDFIQVLYKQPKGLLKDGFFKSFFMEIGDFHGSLIADTENAQKYNSINSFEARLWNKLGADFGCLLMGHPVRNLSLSIEAELPDNHSLQEVDAEISAGCMWLIHASQLIWSLSQRETKTEGQKDWRGVLWREGSEGFSVARWKFWMERLNAMVQGKGPDVTDETRRYAKSALHSMRAVQDEAPSS
jgi:hypothetical protein